MEQFHASSANDQVAGDSILAFINAMGAFRARALKVLEAHGIPEPQPGAWYPLQSYLDALREIHGTGGAAMIAAIGRKLVEGHRFPREIDSVWTALATLDRDYHARHRGDDVGSFQLEQTGPSSARMLVRNPYPCELDRSLIEALAIRFRPPGALLRVEHPGTCRNEGAEVCTLQLRW
jgi:hypothetical protein